MRLLAKKIKTPGCEYFLDYLAHLQQYTNVHYLQHNIRKYQYTISLFLMCFAKNTSKYFLIPLNEDFK